MTERTRRGTRRAVRIGVLRVDLISLRRDRTRALAHLGERALSQWNAGALGTLGQDAEAARLRELIAGIDRTIEEKMSELSRLQAGEEPPPEGGTGAREEAEPVEARSQPVDDDGRGPS
ncbi:MAG TPA: hypothetical protein VF363_09355 [Candidatus Eisenbacteria bacterium]